MNNTLIVKVDESQIRLVVKQAVEEALCATEAKYFNKKEASRYLKISTVTLWDYERKGHIQPVKVGGRLMYTKGELDRFSSGITKTT